jgi:spore maturation protein CgeB
MKYEDKKILLVGNGWHGNFTMYIHSAIKALGYNCEHINLNAFDRKPFVFRKLYLRSRRSAITAFNKFLAGKLETENIGLLIVLANFDVLPSTMEVIRNRNIRTLGWHGDDPLKKGGALLQNIRFCDKAYLVDEEWVNLSRYINPNIDYLPLAAEPAIFKPLEMTSYDTDVVFVGDSYGGLPDGHLRAEILRLLYEKGFKVKLYGPDSWSNLFPAYPFLKDILVAGTVGPEELNRLYNSARIVLNVHHSQLKTGTNQRTFEMAASGAFQLADYRRAVGELFGESVVTFRSAEELIGKVKHFLDHEEERASLSMAAREKVLAGHTYAHRVRKLLEG